MSRGHERSAIFREDEDREKFHSVLSAVVADERWELRGYCLMGNHYHGDGTPSLRRATARLLL